MLQIIRASHLGFCFGVRDALQTAALISEPERTTILGELVHNESVNGSLRRRGFGTVAESDRQTMPTRSTVMITAHGISDRRRQTLTEAGKQLVDTTCPLVRRVHAAATGLIDQGYFVVLLGSPEHVEVLGVTEDLPPGRFAVWNDPADIQSIDADRIGVVMQTTFPPDVAARCRDALSHANPDTNLRWISTICRPTRQRQTAVDELCQAVPLVVVVGGANSNNTRRLVERCKSFGTRAVHVQTAADLNAIDLAGQSRIGLTAGTSTPDETIDAVERRIRELTAPADRWQWTPGRWAEHFADNLQVDPPVPWSGGPTLTASEAAAVIGSIQIFQLGESGEGNHIRRVAARWVAAGGDGDYLVALQRFLAEENRHADWLERFLTAEGHPVLTRQWSDGLFRRIRHAAGLRTSIQILLTAEILAQVYYLSLLRATDSPVLRAICRRVLADERSHVVFQQSQSDRLIAGASGPRRWILNAAETVGFWIARRIVWSGHRDVFAAAGMSWRDYRDRTARRWAAARRHDSVAKVLATSATGQR